MTNVYHSLAGGSLTQNWSNNGLITTNDNWSGVPSIEGFLGDINAADPTNVDPRTLTDAALGAIDVIANQANPNTFTTGGVAEFDDGVRRSPSRDRERPMPRRSSSILTRSAGRTCACSSTRATSTAAPTTRRNSSTCSTASATAARGPTSRAAISRT